MITLTKTDLDKKLALACDKTKPDLDEIRELIIAGADTNQLNEYGDNIFEDIFVPYLYKVYDDNDGTEDEKAKAFVQVKNILKTMLDYGWNSQKFGLQTLGHFTLSFYDKNVFDVFKFFMNLDLGNDEKAYEQLLEGIGTEESYQRCCENCHELENLFYTIYELVLAKKEGRNYKSIELYDNVIGLTIDKIFCFDDTNSLVEKENFTEFNSDLGFLCGDKLLVLCDGINILFMNDRIEEQPKIDISNAFGKDVIGHKIKSVSFEHKELVKGTTHYGQPTIILELDCGKKMKFTHNFGELPDNQSQSRFWVQ